MAENLNKKPSKSILKNSSSFDAPDVKLPAATRPKGAKGSAKWDEMNIMATLHPPDKDYGHMKIDEPKTPYNYEGLDLDVDALDAATLAERIRQARHETPKALHKDDESEEDDEETSEEKAAKREFEQKRKKHYNEFYAVKLARKLLEKEEDDDDDDDDEENTDIDEELQKSLINKEINRDIARANSGGRGRALNCTPCRPPKSAPVGTSADACTASKSSVGTKTGPVCAEACETAPGACAKSRRCGCLDAIRKIFCRGMLARWKT